jgi:rubrerythrin
LSGKSFITTLKNIMGYNYPDTNTSAVESITQQLPTAVQPEIQNQPAIQSEYNPPQQESPQSQNSNLLTCPDCGQMVSRRADVCPNCGCPVSEMN